MWIRKQRARSYRQPPAIPAAQAGAVNGSKQSGVQTERSDSLGGGAPAARKLTACPGGQGPRSHAHCATRNAAGSCISAPTPCSASHCCGHAHSLVPRVSIPPLQLRQFGRVRSSFDLSFLSGLPAVCLVSRSPGPCVAAAADLTPTPVRRYAKEAPGEVQALCGVVDSD